jgi:hypothetical protein
MRVQFLLFLFIPLLARADENVTPPPVSSSQPKASRQGGKLGKRAGSEKKGAPRGSVHGHCTLLESPMNPLTGPCISVPLELKDTNGVSLGISRTSVSGDFEFRVESASPGPFSLAPSSSHYLLISPITGVRRGEAIDLRIREKD